MNPLFENLNYTIRSDSTWPGWDNVRLGIMGRIARTGGIAHTLGHFGRSLPEGAAYEDLVAKFTNLQRAPGLTAIVKDLQVSKDLGPHVYDMQLVNMMGTIGVGIRKFSKQGVTISCVSDCREAADEILRVFIENTEEFKEAPGTVYALQVAAGGAIAFKSLPGQAHNPIVTENYNLNVLAAFDRIREELVASTPKGRITIVDGPPGTGKTFFLRSLLAELCSKTRFIIVAPADLPGLAEPGGLSALLNFKAEMQAWSGINPPITLLVEDGDACVAPRDGGNNSAVAAVLNMADGLMGQLLDLRILLTTNAKRQDLDEAIIRPGRLSTNLHIGKLDPERAISIYHRLGGPMPAPSLSDKTLAQVYQLATDPAFSPVRIGANPLGYRA